MFVTRAGKTTGFGGDKPLNNGDNRHDFMSLQIRPGNIIRARITHTRIADGRDGVRRRAAALARAGAVVGFARTGRLRGMRRHRREGGDQGGQDRGAVGMQREIRRAAEARRRLHLFRFHAKPDFRYRRSQSDAARAEANRRTIHRLSRQSASEQHRSRVRGETTAAAAGLAKERSGKDARDDGEHREATNRSERHQAHEGHRLRAAFILLRMATALRRDQGSEEDTVRLCFEQAKAKLSEPGSISGALRVLRWPAERTGLS